MVSAETSLGLYCLYITQQVWGYFREGRNEQVLPSSYVPSCKEQLLLFFPNQPHRLKLMAQISAKRP